MGRPDFGGQKIHAVRVACRDGGDRADELLARSGGDESADFDGRLQASALPPQSWPVMAINF